MRTLNWSYGWLLCCLMGCGSISGADKLKFVEDSGTGEETQGVTKQDAGDAAAPGLPDAAVDDNDASVEEPEPVRCLLGEGADCNLVTQCGCTSGQRCSAVGDTLRPTCVSQASDAVAAGAACNGNAQCPNGQGCDRGSCRTYCSTDKDCDNGSCVPARLPNRELADQVSVCWDHCDLNDAKACAAGTTCRSTKTPFAKAGTFCVAPYDECPTTDDGTCDEAKGTGTCAAGTDKKDCECAPLQEGACDIFEQCGCPHNATCFTYKNVAECTVEISGTRTFGEHCELPTECLPGLSCLTGTMNVCSHFCRTDEHCPEGASCLFLQDGDPTTFNAGVCLSTCSPETNSCAEGLTCADLRPFLPGHHCWQSQTNCDAVRRDGKCQEDTGFCAKGSDPEDCCTSPFPGGTCDPVANCGCEDQPGTQCQVTSIDGPVACRPEGAKKEGEQCDYIAECSAGTTCADHVCRRWCNVADPDCEAESSCIPLAVAGAPDSTIDNILGACHKHCDFNGNDCPTNTVCMQLNASIKLNICNVPHEACLPSLIGNNQCDDTSVGGTRQCALGTDPDCN